MKPHVLILLLASSLSGCAARAYAYGHHPQGDCGGGQCCTTGCNDPPRPPEPRPDEHVHQAGCGHALDGGVWVQTGAALGSLGGSVSGSITGNLGAACAGTPFCR